MSNPGGEERVYLIGVIQDAKGKRLSTVRSAVLQLRTGHNNLDRLSVTTTRADYNDADIQRIVLSDGVFPPGDYAVCVAVMRQDDDRELGIGCLSQTVLPVRPDQPREADKKRDRLRFYGNAALEGVYADRQGPNQTLPPSYARFDFNPGLSLFQIPVVGRLHLSTERGPGYPDMNTYNISFDRATFRQNMQNVLLQKLNESAQKQAGLDAAALSKLKELDRVQSVLDDPALQRELLGLDSIQQQIKTLESNPKLNLSEKQQKVAKLRQRYDTVMAKKRQVDRLIDQKNRLVAYKSQLERSGRLDEIKNRVTELPNLNDPRVLRAEMKQYGLLEGINRRLFAIEELSIGTAWPVYSPMTINGIQVEGGHLAWNPGPVFLSVTGGKTQSAIFENSAPEASLYKQKMIGAKIGFGKIYGTHFALTGLRFSDDPQSLRFQDSTVQRFPTQTTVGATDIQLVLGKKRQFELSGEAAGLLFNRNRNDTRSLMPVNGSEQIPSALNPTLSTGADFAWNGKLALQLFHQHTRLLGFSRFVGPGFINPGTPGLRNDLLSYEGRLEQSMLRGKLRFTGGYRLEKDNFSGAKGLPTDRTQWLAEAAIRMGKQSNLRFQVIRNQQINKLIEYGSDVLNANLSQGWQIGSKTRANTNFNYLRFTNAVDSFSAAQYDAHYVMLNQMFSFPKGISASLNGQWTLLNNNLGQQTQLVFGANLSARLFKKLRAGGGFSWSQNPQIDQKLGAQFQINWPVSSHVSFDLQGNFNQFSNLPGTTTAFQEQFVRGRLQVRW